MKTNEQIKSILEQVNEQIGNNLVLRGRNGYFAIDNELPSAGSQTLETGLSLREALLWVKAFQKGIWTISSASVKC